MDIYILIPVLSVMHSWIWRAAVASPTGWAPTASTATQGRHVRNKRCSCATFMDKECVYFCHLDIIWVNTPERVVSYGLGNAPRTRRAAPDSMATGGGPRCQCFREDDSACRNFCRLEKHRRHETQPDALIRNAEGRGCEAGCKQRLEADRGGKRRARDARRKRASPPAAGVAVRTRLLLQKWRAARQRRRARAWEGESAAS